MSIFLQLIENLRNCSELLKILQLFSVKMNQTASFSQLSQGFSLDVLFGVINNNFIAYGIPGGIVLTLLNNVIVIALLAKKGTLRSKLGKTVRIYYLAMAFGDISTALASHLRLFLGILSV